MQYTKGPVKTQSVSPHVYPGDDDVSGGEIFNLDDSTQAGPIARSDYRWVLWKIDLVIIPLISGSVILSAVDKVTISNAAIHGMKSDNNLSSGMFSWVGSVFYFGYLIFEYPSAILIQRLPVAKLLASSVMMWAILMCCTAATHNFAGLMVVRFIMGMTEAAVFPICSILTVMWYRTEEQPIRVAFWYNMFSSVFSGIVSYGIGHAHTTLAPWRLLFIALGAFSALWAVLLWVVLPDHPMKCKFLSKYERDIAIERIRENNTGIEDRTIKWYQLKECLVDPKTWLLAIFVCAQNIPNGCLITFSALIVSSLGYSSLKTTLIGIPTGVLATLWQVILSVPCSRLKNRRCLIIAVANLVPMVSAILMWQLPSNYISGRLAAYFVFYTYWGPYVMSTTLPMANTSGHTKKVTMNAIFFVAYCIGNIIGPQVFRASDAPNYPRGYAGLLACFIIASVSISLYAVICKWENKQRERKQNNASSQHETTDPLSDLTEKRHRSGIHTDCRVNQVLERANAGPNLNCILSFYVLLV